MATFTAPNGATRTSKTRVYTHAILLTGEDTCKGKVAFAWASSKENADKALATARRRGLSAEIVEVTNSDAPVETVEEAPAAKPVAIKVMWRSESGRTGERTVTSEEEAKSLIHIYRRSGLQAIRSLV